MKSANDLQGRTCLVVTADDFGRSLSINAAVEKAAQCGLLTGAGLMVAGRAAQNAVDIARRVPSLQTGLHLTLTEPHPLQGAGNGRHSRSPAFVGIALQLSKAWQERAEREVAAQFEAFAETGLPFHHVDSHHHLHLHPKLFDIMLKYAVRYRLKTVRIPWEPWSISGGLCKKHYLRNLFYRKVFTPLASACRKKLEAAGLMSCDGVFGLYATGGLDESWLLGLIGRLKGLHGTYELYTHPDSLPGSSGRLELDALLSSAVKIRMGQSGIRTICYTDVVQRN